MYNNCKFMHENNLTLRGTQYCRRKVEETNVLLFLIIS